MNPTFCLKRLGGEKERFQKKKKEKTYLVHQKYLPYYKKRGRKKRQKVKPGGVNTIFFVFLIIFNAFSVAEDYLEAVSVCSCCGAALRGSPG